MAEFPSHRSASSLLLGSVLFSSACFVLVFSCVDMAHAQTSSQPESTPQSSTLDQTLEVHNLPSLMAKTPHSSDVMLTSLDTVFHDREVCCGKDSALEDTVQTIDTKSLQDAASKLSGRHLLSDGRAVQVTANYLTPDQINAGDMLAQMVKEHAPLMEWNHHIYVVHGLAYLWYMTSDPDSGGSESSVIHKILLWDTRYSDSRREVVFNRETDDPKTIQGVLFLESKTE